MTLMELINESAVQNVASWNPASLLRTITLPVYQLLITPAPTPHINEPPHRIGWQPLNESGGRSGRDQGLKGGAKDGLYLGNMENRVDFIKLWARPFDHTRKVGAWYGDGPPTPFSSRQSG